MGFFNRGAVNRTAIVAFLLIWMILWAAAVIVVLVSPTEAVSTANNVVSFLERNNTVYTRLMFAVVGTVFILVALLLLVAELAPSEVPAVRLSQVAGGTALLTTEAIVQRLKYDVEHLDQVGEAKPEVRSRGEAVDVRLEVRTAPDADIVGKTEEICGVVREVVEGMGAKLNRPPTVYIHPEPLLVPLAARRAEATTGQPASVAEQPRITPAPEVAAEVEGEDEDEGDVT